MKKIIIIFYIFFTIILTYSIVAKCSSYKGEWKCNDDTKNVNINNDGSYSCESSCTINGITYSNLKNIITNSDGTLNCKSNCEINGIQYSNLENVKVNNDGSYSCESSCTIGNLNLNAVNTFKQNSDGSYSIDEVEFYSDGTKKVLQGKNLAANENRLDVEQAQTVENEGSTVIEVEEYKSNENDFEVSEAKRVVTDNIIFSDVGESSFEYDESNKLSKATVVSNKENNTILVRDTEIILNKKDKVIIEKTEDKLIIDVDAKNATITDYKNDVGLIRLTNGSKYINEADKDHKFSFVATDNISIQIITDSVTSPNIGQSTVVMNLNTSKLTINGMVDYQNPDIYNLTYVNVIESKSRDNEIQYDISQNTIYINNGYASFYSGPFEVKFEGNEVYYRTNLVIHPPYVINKINQNILIDSSGSLNRKEQNNNYFLYADNSDSNTDFLRKFEELLP